MLIFVVNCQSHSNQQSEEKQAPNVQDVIPKDILEKINNPLKKINKDTVLLSMRICGGTIVKFTIQDIVGAKISDEDLRKWINEDEMAPLKIISGIRSAQTTLGMADFAHYEKKNDTQFQKNLEKQLIFSKATFLSNEGLNFLATEVTKNTERCNNARKQVRALLNKQTQLITPERSLFTAKVIYFDDEKSAKSALTGIQADKNSSELVFNSKFSDAKKINESRVEDFDRIDGNLIPQKLRQKLFMYKNQVIINPDSKVAAQTVYDFVKLEDKKFAVFAYYKFSSPIHDILQSKSMLENEVIKMLVKEEIDKYLLSHQKELDVNTFFCSGDDWQKMIARIEKHSQTRAM